jgi:hypothetical protein
MFDITLQMTDLPSEVQSLLGMDWMDRSRQQLAGTWKCPSDRPAL